MSSPQLWAVVPVKSFTCAKQRLMPLLCAHERTGLARAMFGVLDNSANAGLVPAVQLAARHLADAKRTGMLVVPADLPLIAQRLRHRRSQPTEITRAEAVALYQKTRP